MNAFITLVPILFVRYVLMSVLSKEGLRRAAFFPPVDGAERPAYWVYQISTVILLVYPFFLTIKTGSAWFYLALLLYCIGVVLCAISVFNFAKPDKRGINQNGLYRISRNPMYVSYFVCFLGCALLTRSILLLAVLSAFQISAHWIILSEERWCVKEFGDAYIEYSRKVRRYL